MVYLSVVEWRHFWDSCVPPRVLVFCCMASLQKILTMDRLRRKNCINVNGCLLCLNEETAKHLLIHCNYARKVWVSIIDMSDMSWAMLCTIMELFQQWKHKGSSIRGRILWRLSLYAGLWKICLERSNRIFENKSKSADKTVQSIVWNVSEWASKKVESAGVSLEDLNRSWATNLIGGRHSKIVHRNLPPASLLKLNLYGNFFKHVILGGIGGVIGDSSAVVVKKKKIGPLSSSDSYGAEVYPLLIGCRELRKVGGYKAIIEGDSFSAIQWASGKSPFPWGLTDLVKKRSCKTSRLNRELLLITSCVKLMLWQMV